MIGKLTRLVSVPVLAGMVFASSWLVSPVYARSAIDVNVRNNTADMAKQAEGIHEDTTSTDASYKSIDESTQKTLEYMTQVWRQGEQETRSMDDTQRDEGTLGENSGSAYGTGGASSDLSESNYNSIIDGLINKKKVSFEDVLGGLSGKDSELYNKLMDVLPVGDLYKLAGWGGARDAVHGSLKSELEKLMGETAHTDIFPELSQEDFSVYKEANPDMEWKDYLVAKSGETFDEKFPVLPEEAQAEQESIINVQMYEQNTNDHIFNEDSKVRSKSVQSRLALLIEAEASRKRLADMMKVLPYVEGTRQLKDLETVVKAETGVMQGLKMQMDMNRQAERSFALQAQERIAKNSQDARAKGVSLWSAQAAQETDSYQEYLKEQGTDGQ